MNSKMPPNAPPPPAAVSDEVRLAAVQEELAVDVRKTETGAVRVRKVVHEEMQSVAMRLRSEQVEVSRVAVNRAVDERSEPRQEGNTLIIPVYEYVPVVRMQLTLKEEVHIKTTESQRDMVHQVLVNTEELIVERREGAEGEWRRDPTVD
ncbi:MULTISPECIES: YsnF/AvaK domain-containing protein [unclassified Caballeronia]|uniref:YsnF/AvaK domain-containing protein n=1 Tax=unclassified Caballeronia TaxID=2646786 RepID=UPI002855422A|nr:MULTISPECIES: YsnF/AvaK domain-containing protein [unclassified Caballeronia]MDR5776684.1 YsnF/AvaK domain-containing protein [Caballeronia sp. LZ002]MDR5798513.1 YsnF/AvaK domain-containing protein [Caballeronia sp. LZ001]MDR5852117.1 YsnF/AvaK domain-containing protein [Caballeronia sp. LZ003]